MRNQARFNLPYDYLCRFQANPACVWGRVNQIMTVAQNKLIAKGYTTTRILAAPQDLNNGQLVLTVIPGRVTSALMTAMLRQRM